MAGEASALSHALHADKQFVAQPGRALVSRDHAEAPATGTFRSVRELIQAIVEYVEAHNEQAQRMFWKALPDEILAKVRRARAILDNTPTA